MRASMRSPKSRAFTIDNPIPTDNLRRAINRLLPPAIRIHEVAEMHAGFHPRFDAKAKTYRYTFSGPRYVRHSIGVICITTARTLDEDRMIAVAPVFEGEHDFSVFAASNSWEEEGLSKVRTVFQSRLEREGDLLVYTVRGSGFLKHMVRNIVGTLLEIGRGNIEGTAFPAKCGSTAPARGLTLISVEYD